MELKGDSLIVSVLVVSFCVAVISRWISILQQLGETILLKNVLSKFPALNHKEQKSINSFPLQKALSLLPQKPLRPQSVTKIGDKLWWTKFCSCDLNLFPVLLSHFPQPSQWHCGHFTRLASKDSICLPKTVPRRAATTKTPKRNPNEKREIIPKIRTFLKICGKSTCISLKVIRADMRIMLILTQILCLSLRLVTHITKDLDKQKWLTLSSFKPDVPQPFFHDSILYAWSEFFYNVLFREFRWLCTPD